MTCERCGQAAPELYCGLCARCVEWFGWMLDRLRPSSD